MSSLFTSTSDRDNSVPFAALASSRSRVVLLGAPEFGLDRLPGSSRSLTFEHVTVSALLRADCGRLSPSRVKRARAQAVGCPVPDEIVLSVVRKWFWSRRSGRGFLLQGFPVTLGHALVFDEWLEARGETLDRVLLPESSRTPVADEVVSHYKNQAILARFRLEDCDDGRLLQESAVVLAGR